MRMYRYLLCIVGLFMLLPGNGHIAAQDNVIDRVEWVVGDKAILRSDIEAAISFWLGNGRRFEGDPYCIMGEDLAVQELFLHQAELDSVEVPEMQLMHAVDEELNRKIMIAGSKEKLEELSGMAVSKWREKLREMLRNSNLMSIMRNKIVGDVKVSPALVRRYYNSLPDDSIPFIPEQFEVQIITVDPSYDSDELERVKADLREYTERISRGETTFSAMALLYSQDESSARRGGELEFMSRSRFAPEFADVAFGLTDPNKISKIVETEYGFHIIQLIEKRNDMIKVRHILRKPEISSEDIKANLLALDSIADDVRAGKLSFDDAVYQNSHDVDTRNNYGIMYNKQTASSRFTLQELPVEVARSVGDMQVGDVSSPFTMILPNGKVTCAVVRLKSRFKGHKATLQDDYEALKELYMATVGEKKVNQWIKEKQATTFVWINKDNRSCEFKYPGWVFYEEK